MAGSTMTFLNILVREIYRGLFGREPTPEELYTSTAVVLKTGSLTQLVEDLLNSDEFRQKCVVAVAPEVVRAAYKGILGREPDPGGFTAHTARLEIDKDIESLLSAMVASPEFNHKMVMVRLPDLRQAGKAGSVKIETTPEQFARLFERVRDEWTKLGDTDPHWSVIVHEQFKSQNFAEHEEEFYQSGRAVFSIIENTFNDAGMEINRAGTVLELGCGTGRVTHILADVYARVIAVDVSPGNLRLCQEKLHRLGKTNVTFMLLKSPRDIQNIPPIDFFFSTIVLQHNPPPIIHYFLSEIFGKIRKSGCVLFQVPTHIPGYSFEVNQYLESPVPVMEMHSVPMQAVFSLLAKNQLRPVEVLMDGSTGMLGSHTFFAIRE
jgi:SAM-dependent methyltransferase